MLTSYLLCLLIVHHRITAIHSIESSLDNAPPDHEIPYSEHEDPGEPPTRPKYEKPGQWAKPLDKNILEFVPSTMYAQVRGSHTVERVPRSQALLDASTEEERENAGRLREVVTNDKVNTIYTEEGYEDAAYDHAGHQRDADFHEGYDKNIANEDSSREILYHESSETTEAEDVPANEDSDDHAASMIDGALKLELQRSKPETGSDFGTEWIQTGVNPITFVKRQGLRLEKHVMNEEEQAARGAETQPKSSSNESGETGNSSEQQIKRADYERRSSTKKVAPKKVEGKKPFMVIVPAVSPLMTDDDEKYYPSYRDIMGTSTLHPTTVDHGKVFWDYFKTQKPTTDATLASSNRAPSQKQQYYSSEDSKEAEHSREYAASREERVTEPTQESAETSTRRNTSGSREFSSELLEMSAETSRPFEYMKAPPEPSQDSTATSPGVIQAILKSPQVVKAINAQKYSGASSAEDHPTTRATRDSPGTKRPVYTVIIRAPSKPCDERSDEFNYDDPSSKYDLLRDMTNSVNPRLVNYAAMSNNSMIVPPVVGPFGQVTYADYLRTRYGRLDRPSESDEESGQYSDETGQYSVENPPVIQRPQPYRPQRQSGILPFFSWLSHLNPVAKFIPSNRILPPSPRSRSRYAEYAVRRSGIELPTKNWSDVPYGDAFQANGSATRRFKRQSADERVFADPLKNPPRIVEGVIDGEINTRFREQSGEGSSEEVEHNEDSVDIEVPEFDFSEIFNSTDNPEVSKEMNSSNDTFSSKKYPFYGNNEIPMASPLKYVINPDEIPKKSLGGMEFYNSRDEYLVCDEVDPDLSQVAPDNEEPKQDQGPNENLPRLKGLGDKLSCFKAKYFDKNPLDNPLFLENKIDTPQMPKEFDPRKFEKRISDLSGVAEALVMHRISRKPEQDLHPSDSKRNRVVHQQMARDNHNPAPNHRPPKKRHRGRYPVRVMHPIMTPYERQVYDDVMGTIKNQAGKRPPQQPRDRAPHRHRGGNHVQTKGRPHHGCPDHRRPPAHRPPKAGPYRTDRVAHPRRPRFQSGTAATRIGYYRTLRIHKRSINGRPDLQTEEAQDIHDWKPIKINTDGIKQPYNNPQSIVVTPWTTMAPAPFSKPDEKFGYAQFKNEVGTVDARRKEPRYRDPNEKPSISSTYKVYEDDMEEVNETPPGDEPKEYSYSEPAEYNKFANSNESAESAESEEVSTSRYAVEEHRSEEDTSGGNESQEEKHDQVEKPESSVEESSERLEDDRDSSGESHSNEEEKNARMSEAETDAERFSSRPESPGENYHDPKYADLGPRINKPPFHHPPFDPKGVKKEQQNRSTKYVFPWDQDEKKEAVRVAERALAKYEYPWERRERLSREGAKEKVDKKKNNRDSEFYHRYFNDEDDDQSSSESEFNFEAIHPWPTWGHPHKTENFRRFWSSDMFESDEVVPPKFSSKYNTITPQPKYIPTTTSTPQIPPTSVTSPPKRESTTPINEVTTKAQPTRWTVRPRSLRWSAGRTRTRTPLRTTQDPKNTESASSVIISTPNTVARETVGGSPPSHQTTSSAPGLDGNEPTTSPAKRTIKHESRVSTEEIITKTSYPSSDPRADQHKSSGDDELQRSESIHRVSIVTKETPERIYKTKKVDKNGVKGTFIIITPNNRTDRVETVFGSMDDSREEDLRRDMDIDDRMDDPHVPEEADLPDGDHPNRASQRSEHNTRKVVSTVSWVTERHDY